MSDPCVWAINYFLKLSRVPKILAVTRKKGFLFFFHPKIHLQTYFSSKISREHPRNLVKSIHDLQKTQETTSKSKINLKLKIFPSSDLFAKHF